MQAKTLAKRKLLVVTRKGLLKSIAKNENILSLLPGALPRGLLGFGRGDSHPFFERYKVKPKIDLLFDNYDVALKFIERKPAWALVPDWIAEEYADNVEPFRAEKIYEHLEITSIRSKSRPATLLAELVEQEIEEIFQSDRRSKSKSF